jgi:hypothetical protein
MGAFCNELASLDIVYRVSRRGGLNHKEKKVTLARAHLERRWDVKKIKANDGVASARNYPMSFKFLEALDAQSKVAERRGVMQIIHVYGIDAGCRKSAP